MHSAVALIYLLMNTTLISKLKKKFNLRWFLILFLVPPAMKPKVALIEIFDDDTDYKIIIVKSFKMV